MSMIGCGQSRYTLYSKILIDNPESMMYNNHVTKGGTPFKYRR